jgi:hypothetical protein
MKLKWKWLLWQVFVPLGGPIIVSALVAFAWQSGQPQFPINWSIILDVTPWAMTFYCLTLIGATMNELWPQLSSRPVLGLALMITGLLVCVYGAFIVIWRHDPDFEPPATVYIYTVVLLAISVGLCHHAARE